jgi:acyl dehydratase
VADGVGKENRACGVGMVPTTCVTRQRSPLPPVRALAHHGLAWAEPTRAAGGMAIELPPVTGKGEPMDGPKHSMTWDEIVRRVGSSFGASEWVVVTQSVIDAFAAATHDHYFLHVDPARASATPFKGTIAHGLLTLSLLPAMGYQVCPYIEGARYPLNYGFDKVRFVAPVPVGSRVRAHFVLRRAETIRADQRQLLYDATVEVEGSERPALVAAWLMRYVV